MVARILHECNVDLGPEEKLLPPKEDNIAGFWENTDFVQVNDELLYAFGGAWDLPPELPETWEQHPRVTRLQERAQEIIRELALCEPWAWKDPRNSLTLPFWRTVLPDLKLIICLREPLEVAGSLAARTSSPSRTFPLDLWLAYNQRLLQASKQHNSIVTHYDSYFTDPRAEVRRVLAALGVPAADDTLERAAESVRPAARHHRAADEVALERAELEVMQCYRELCKQAGPVYKVQMPESHTATSDSSGSELERELVLLRRAHQVLQRRVLGDRTAFAEQVQASWEGNEKLRQENADLGNRLVWLDGVIAQQAEELEWRTGVMERQEAQLIGIHNSRVYRYTRPLRAAASFLRRREK
jgi:hypothetical protein